VKELPVSTEGGKVGPRAHLQATTKRKVLAFAWNRGLVVQFVNNLFTAKSPSLMLTVHLLRRYEIRRYFPAERNCGFAAERNNALIDSKGF
jgi:hypothetical protein